MTVNLRSLGINDVWLLLAVTLAALAGKLLGAAGGARLGGFPGHDSWQLGAGMVARGEVTLIVAAAGSRAGLINGSTFSAIVVAVLVSTLVTPLLLRLFSRQTVEAANEAPEGPIDHPGKDKRGAEPHENE